MGCQLGRASTNEQPLPAPDHAVSVQPRESLDPETRCVPPTATTPGEVAGYSGPVPLSPELTVIVAPGWV